MKSIKKKISRVSAKFLETVALKACGTASAFGYCQPKEPSQLEKLVK